MNCKWCGSFCCTEEDCKNFDESLDDELESFDCLEDVLDELLDDAETPNF